MPNNNKKTQRPIMALLDLLGQKWVLRIIWELREAPLTFRACANGATRSHRRF